MFCSGCLFAPLSLACPSFRQHLLRPSAALLPVLVLLCCGTTFRCSGRLADIKILPSNPFRFAIRLRCSCTACTFHRTSDYRASGCSLSCPGKACRDFLRMSAFLSWCGPSHFTIIFMIDVVGPLQHSFIDKLIAAGHTNQTAQQQINKQRDEHTTRPYSQRRARGGGGGGGARTALSCAAQIALSHTAKRNAWNSSEGVTHRRASTRLRPPNNKIQSKSSIMRSFGYMPYSSNHHVFMICFLPLIFFCSRSFHSCRAAVCELLTTE